MNVDVWMLVVTALIGAAPGLLAAGGLWAKVTRLEKDVDARVSRELFDVHVKNVEKDLTEIKTMLALALNRRRVHDDTNPGA